MIESFLGKFGEGTRKDFEALLIPKLSDVLTETQKRAKVKRICYKQWKEIKEFV